VGVFGDVALSKERKVRKEEGREGRRTHVVPVTPLVHTEEFFCDFSVEEGVWEEEVSDANDLRKE
jgi:hypothetical protein